MRLSSQYIDTERASTLSLRTSAKTFTTELLTTRTAELFSKTNCYIGPTAVEVDLKKKKLKERKKKKIVTTKAQALNAWSAYPVGQSFSL